MYLHTTNELPSQDFKNWSIIGRQTHTDRWNWKHYHASFAVNGHHKQGWKWDMVWDDNATCRHFHIMVCLNRGVFRICWRGAETKPEGPRCEARIGPRAGMGFLGRGQLAPSPPARGSGERCKLPQRGPGRSPGRQTVLLHFKYSGWPLLTPFLRFFWQWQGERPPPPVNPPLCLKTYRYYTVNHKKRDILFLTITLASLNRHL